MENNNSAKINWIVETFSNFSGGHSYHAAVFTNTNTGKSFRARVDAAANARMAVFIVLCNGNSYEFYSTEREMKTGEFNRFTKRAPYLTGSVEEMAKVVIEKTS